MDVEGLVDARCARGAVLAVIALAVGCTALKDPNARPLDAGATMDGSRADAGAAGPDGALPDSALADAFVPMLDAGGIDAGMSDGGPPDAEPRPDAGPGSDAGAGADAGTPPLIVGCAPFPAATGAVVRVTPAQANALPAMVAGAASGTTILLEDGTYRSTASGESNRRVIFRTPDVTLRSASGNAAAVILDGEYLTNELLNVVASDVTIAELTLTRAVDHLARVTSETSARVTGVRFHGVRFIDAGEQFLKVNPGESDGWIDEGVLECSTFELTDAGRPNIERAGGGCYTGGIDAHAARGWVVRHNRFEDIYCAGEGLAEHAVHFWRSGRDTLVENNVILNCARGIGFGFSDTMEHRAYADDPYPSVGVVAHYDGVIRNNVIFATVAYQDTGIELHRAHGARVHHNTVVSADSVTDFFSSIDSRFDTTSVELRNNLTRRITERDDAAATREANLESTPLAYFVDATGGDFHLVASATEAIDRGVVVADPGLDLDGERRDRGAAPDLGADER